MPEWAMLIGGVIRWLLKGCKTSLREEVEKYDFTNYFLGIIFCLVVSIIIGLILTLL